MTEPALGPGRKVADYLIEKALGRGGMAELFLARDVMLQRSVVIKALAPQFGHRQDLRKRFLREARILAGLDNPYIVQIYRVFNHQDRLCLAMQHVRGTDLARVIQRAHTFRQGRGEGGALSPERAAHIFLQVLEGMGAVHKYRIVHGDLKPANILLDRQGRVKVADFGLSFLLPPARQEQDGLLQGGTLSFMSPEQALGRDVDFRADIYSLGVTFFNMLTGALPTANRRSATELLEYHLEGRLEEPRGMLETFAAVPPRIKEALLKALACDPNDRHQSCLEFSLAIKEEAPYEMYSELLRLSLLGKKEITYLERVHLDRIARRKGLGPEEAGILEANIRRELRLPGLDFEAEYRRAFGDLLLRGRGEGPAMGVLDRIYLQAGRVVPDRAAALRAEARAAMGRPEGGGALKDQGPEEKGAA